MPRGGAREGAGRPAGSYWDKYRDDELMKALEKGETGSLVDRFFNGRETARDLERMRSLSRQRKHQQVAFHATKWLLEYNLGIGEKGKDAGPSEVHNTLNIILPESARGLKEPEAAHNGKLVGQIGTTIEGQFEEVEDGRA